MAGFKGLTATECSKAEKNRYRDERAQMRNDQSTCPHLASSTWMELITGLNVGIVRKKKWKARPLAEPGV